MNKALSFASAMLLGASAMEQGVPPHTHDCATPTGAVMALGLIRDYDMGGCKCADDTAEWMPHAPNKPTAKENWSCWCQLPDMYESMPFKAKKDNRNRRKCGVILEC